MDLGEKTCFEFENFKCADYSDGDKDPRMDAMPVEKSVLTRAVEAVDNWSLKHPGISLLIFFGGGALITYKITQCFVAGAVFKGNIKTLKYLYRISH